MKKFNIKNYKVLFIITVLIVVVVGSRVYAATTVAGSSVTYSNSSSGLSSTTVQGAIDELYNQTDIRKMKKFVVAYTYSTATSTKCITGEESTCVKTTCYKTTGKSSCRIGTIIKYKVNDTEIVTFHVLYDDLYGLIMQSQKNIIYNVGWNVGSNTNTSGPLTALTALESATAGWSNVISQTYTAGTTRLFPDSSGATYTGCSAVVANTCTSNTYTLASRTAKARLITIQEAVNAGCGSSSKCPIWMYNYLSTSASYNGTVNDTSKVPGGNVNAAYWTMTAATGSTTAWQISSTGQIVKYAPVTYTDNGVRAVVAVTKGDN